MRGCYDQSSYFGENQSYGFSAAPMEETGVGDNNGLLCLDDVMYEWMGKETTMTDWHIQESVCVLILEKQATTTMINFLKWKTL